MSNEQILFLSSMNKISSVLFCSLATLFVTTTIGNNELEEGRRTRLMVETNDCSILFLLSLNLNISTRLLDHGDLVVLLLRAQLFNTFLRHHRQ